jgi:hypothetical protein
MDSIQDPPTGYRTVQADQDRARWRHRLFTHLREAPSYRDMVRATSDHEDAADSIATRLGLVKDGQPCPWAVDFIRADLAGTFRPDRVPVSRTVATRRTLDIRASLNGMSVDTRRSGDRHDKRTASRSHQPHVYMQLGDEDWDALERIAVEAAREAVRDMRAEFKAARRVPGIAPRTRIKAGNEATRELQLERLTLRLAGRAGVRNTPKVDRDWCKRLDIDTPSSA